ncbi:UDP-N-acetylglucosamine 2-epimerase [Rubritalea sp.]|uniref:UDP-N-acetylglucosamine 2-epimerase n=1 Tax=Rubritalea sp. TaxID=2109375 RepID=UPI003EF82180
MSKVRKITVFTSSRAEYGSFRGLVRALEAHADLELCLIVSGSHLSQSDGFTKSEIEEDGIPIAAEVEMFDGKSTREEFSKALGRELIGVTEALVRHQPAIILINGDRAELLPLATAAVCLGIPIAHIAGGEITEGAIDDSIRHAVTKLSHLHFPTNPLHAQRIMGMGEEPWRVTVTGEPALDGILGMDYLSKEELSEELGVDFTDPVVVVTYHPETLGGGAIEDVRALLEGARRINANFVFTYPNADPGSALILEALRDFCDSHSNAVLVSSLGQIRYYSVLKYGSAMLGNSSSGLWEAPSFGLPVVNVGGRQDGRLRARNVIDVKTCKANDISSALKLALSKGFKDTLKGVANPYGDGTAIQKILDVLVSVDLGTKLLRKKFVDCYGHYD